MLNAHLSVSNNFNTPKSQVKTPKRNNLRFLFLQTLDGKLVEHSMEFGTGVSASVNASRQNGAKVGHRFWRDFAEKTDLDRTQLGAGYLHVQVRHVSHRERLEVLYIFNVYNMSLQNK